ncbi:hypothetical protein HBA97_00895 [Mycobacteroides chelonae]|uniref:hypothetical protein n=1 Tax=Mycobacteroides chelonae TaxID=1774 RepID=UPI001042206B|nr:hypothetical protein [Mycobacteroides chelonae]QQG85976.1 hypothetical protein HBA99_00895 [Mycobacteroides chelonae]QQG90793.1 hypothetical protein HBA97_00895 [Mycobacteroides chelonae]
MSEGTHIASVGLTGAGSWLRLIQLGASSRRILATFPLMVALVIAPVMGTMGPNGNDVAQSRAELDPGVSLLAWAAAPDCFLCHHDSDGSNVSKRHRTGRH